jgi:hypothetical protein
MRRLLLVTCCLFYISVFSQEEYFKDFGSPALEEIRMTDCAFDPGAVAIYLRKDAVTIPDFQRMIVYYRNRLKILKTSAADLANIRIKFYSFNEYETIENLKAVSINYDDKGNKISSSVEPKNIFITKEDEYYSNITFSMPEVKEGTIIEYSYTSYRKSYKMIDYWYFQDEIPVMHSTYDYTIQPGAMFSYRVLKSPAYEILMKEFKGEGRLFFQMNNLAGITDEPFMDSKRDYMSRLELQMNYSGSGIDRERFVGSWPELTHQLLRDEEFGQQLDHGIAGTAEILKRASTIASGKEKLEFIFNEVCRTMTWDNYIGIYAKDRLKLAWEKRRGSAAEINLILINLFQSAGIKTTPLLVSDRSHGKVDISHPFINQFSKVIAYSEVDSRVYFLDASQKGNSISLIPESLLNTTGYLVDKKNSRFIKVSDPFHYDKRTVNITGKITADGLLHGQAFIMDRDYSRLEKENQIRIDRNRFIHSNFEEPYSKLRVDSLKVENLDNDSLPLNQLIGFTHQLEQSGQYIMLHCNLLSGMEKNPFITNKRFTQINFGCNRSLTFNEAFDIPDNVAPEELPKDIFLIMPDTSISVMRNIQLAPDRRKIILRIKLEMNRSLFEAEDYPAVKDFFKKLYAILDEPIVLKKKSM